MENLKKLLEVEKKQKSLSSRVGNTRHSRFGTTVAVKAVSVAVLPAGVQLTVLSVSRATKSWSCTSRTRYP